MIETIHLHAGDHLYRKDNHRSTKFVLVLELADRERSADMGLGKSEAAQEIIKPLSFKAQNFKQIVLDNKLEFLLVSDPELDKAGAAVDVCSPPFQLAHLPDLKTCASNETACVLDRHIFCHLHPPLVSHQNLV